MVRNEIRNSLVEAVKSKWSDVQVSDFSLEIPENPEHGDYATNIALILARILKKNPIEVASTIAESLVIRNSSFVIKVAPPGFINFWIAPPVLQKELKLILKRKEKYGRAKAKKEKIQIEFISANPTGPLTLANGRGGFLGSALANVLEAAGYKVEREYYVNDAGNQVLTLGKSLLSAAGLISEEESFYKGRYIGEWAGKRKARVKKYRSDPMGLGRLAAKDFLRAIKRVVKNAGINFDRFTSEFAGIHKKKWPDKAKKTFEKSGLTYKKDGAEWLKTTEFGDDKDRVLITSDGFPTYFFADAGHYLETKKRGLDKKINILGPDHYGYVARIQAVAKIIGLKSETVVTQAVRLMRGSEEVKMSKRRGTFVTFEELLKEVPLDAARYFFLEKSPDTHIDFNLDLAKERSMKNPVYYIQYAHARSFSIFKKANLGKFDFQRKSDFQKLNTPEETSLLKKLIQFPEAVEDTARDYQVHRLTRYAHELARSFHNFYEKQRVITEDRDLTQARLALVKATQIVLQIVLDLLGLSAPKKM